MWYVTPCPDFSKRVNSKCVQCSKMCYVESLYVCVVRLVCTKWAHKQTNKQQTNKPNRQVVCKHCVYVTCALVLLHWLKRWDVIFLWFSFNRTVNPQTDRDMHIQSNHRQASPTSLLLSVPDRLSHVALGSKWKRAVWVIQRHLILFIP